MPDFQYQPPTGPLSGSEFERQTTRFFQQVQGAADAAQSTAIVAQNTANDALERAQASNLIDGKTTQAAADGAITVKDVAIGGNLEDLASARGQIGDAKGVGAIDADSLVSAGGYATDNATVNKPAGFAQTLFSVLKRSVDNPTRSVFQIAHANNGPRIGYRTGLSQDGTDQSIVWKNWVEILNSGRIGDGILVTNGIISVPEYEGATASTAGTSGLVPPAAAGQATYVLCGDGEWRDIATLVAAAQARFAESVKAEEGAS